MIHSDANETVVDSVSPGRASPHRARARRRRPALERVGHVAVKRGARRRQRERAMAALEQRNPERVLQRLDLPRQRRLREEQLLGRERERQAASRRLESAQEVQRRQSAQRLMHSLHACKPFELSV